MRGSLPEGICGVGGTLTVLFEDVDLMEKAIDAVESSIHITVEHNQTSIFELEMQELEYGVNAPGIPGPQGLRVSMDYQAYYEAGAGNSAVIARLVNVDQHD